MEGKVKLYDSNDMIIGETFMRRARQLVKQQRASWLDDNQEAIRFAPGAENMDEAAHEVEAAPPVLDSLPYDDALVALAEQRIKERVRIILHSVAIVPGWFFAAILFLNYVGGHSGQTMFWFFLGAWLMAYAIHAFQFIMPRREKIFFGGEERRKKRLETEIASLKAEMRR